MRTNRPICGIGYREDIQEALDGLMERGTISEYAYQWHRSDVKEDGTPKDAHYHILLQPCGQQSVERIVAVLKDETGNRGIAVRPKREVCTNVGTWYGYSVLHDPEVVGDDVTEKYPYKDEEARFSSEEWHEYLVEEWGCWGTTTTKQEAEKAEKAKANREQAQRLDMAIRAGETMRQFMMDEGISIMSTQALSKAWDVAARECHGGYATEKEEQMHTQIKGLRAELDRAQKQLAQQRLETSEELEAYRFLMQECKTNTQLKIVIDAVMARKKRQRADIAQEQIDRILERMAEEELNDDRPW